MSEKLKVYVVDRGRSCLYMRYIDPETGKAVERSTGKKTKAEAKDVAAEWKAELKRGFWTAPSKVTWAEFRRRYEDEQLPSLKETTSEKSARY
jgi:hypothetical protein